MAKGGVVLVFTRLRSVRLNISDGNLCLKVVTPEVGEYEEELSVEYNGDPIEVAFNPDFILEVLKHMESDKVCVVLKDAQSPGVIKPYTEAPEDHYINVVMPIRV